MNTIALNHGTITQERQHLLSLSAMFEGEFTLDWLVELTDMKVSYILTVLEEETLSGILNRIKPAVYSFNKSKRQKWMEQFSSEEEAQFHRNIAWILIREISNDEAIKLEISQHLINVPSTLAECQYLMTAGEIYTRHLKINEARTCFNHILKSLSQQRGEEEDLQFIQATICHSNGYGGRNLIEVNLNFLNEAKKRAAELPDKKEYEFFLEMHIAKYERLNSDFNSSFNRFAKAVKNIKTIKNPQFTDSTTALQILFLFWQGNYVDVIELYENTVSDVQKSPIGYFSVFVSIMIGHTYVMVGQVTQGLGMLDALHSHCLEKNNLFLSSHASSTIAMVMHSINNNEDAIRYLKLAQKEADDSNNSWVKALVALMFTIVFHESKNHKKSISYLENYLKKRNQSDANMLLIPYKLEVSWLIKKGEIPNVSDIPIESEISKMLQLKNCSIKGLAFRYQALLGKLEGWDNKKITHALAQSKELLKKSGNKIESAKINFEMARHFLLQGKNKKAKAAIEESAELLSSFDSNLIPDDLISLIGERKQESDLLEEMAKLADHICTQLDSKIFLQKIIAIANRLIGAERGALLLIGANQTSSDLYLRASKNFTNEQFLDSEFDCNRKMIEEVIDHRKSRISKKAPSGETNGNSKEMIHSSICVPLILKKRVIGALYHDNRLLGNVFNESSLNLLSFFAAMVSLSLDCKIAHEKNAQLTQQINEDIYYKPGKSKKSYVVDGMVGESSAIKKVMDQIDLVAKTDSEILLTGETGVGKNLVASIIHRNSPRKDGNLITVQCSALTESLITSELFGHEKGAFTGAINRQIGRFEMADGGTLFLDEIGDLSLDVQARLLRVLQSKEFERVGGGKEILTSNFRLITATNRNLQQDIKDKRFREDLYYRIAVIPVHIPPLRERREDIPQLVHYFLEKSCEKHGKRYHKLSQKVMDMLVQFDWPGNIRQLEHVIQRSVIISPEPYFHLSSLKTEEPEKPQVGNFLSLMENERQHIEEALQRTRGKIHGPLGAAEILQVNPSTLTSRLKKLGIKKVEIIEEMK